MPAGRPPPADRPGHRPGWPTLNHRWWVVALALAVGDLSTGDDVSRRTFLIWMAVVFAVPFLGVIAYHALGRSRLLRWVRIAVVGGGTAVWLAGLAVSLLVGGVV